MHPPVSYARGALILVFISLWLGAAGSAPGYASLTRLVCAAGGPYNVIPALPRRDRAGAIISSDIGSYNMPLNCTAANGGFSCSMVSPIEGDDWRSSAGAPGSLVQYAEGVALYAVLAFVFALLSILFSIAFVIGRYCCICGCNGFTPTRRPRTTPGGAGKDGQARPSSTPSSGSMEPCCSANGCFCITLQCGRHEPTLRQCCCGVQRLKGATLRWSGTSKSASLRAAEEGGEAYAYPRWEKCLVGCCMFIFVILLTTFLLIGAVKGFLGLPAAAKDVAPALTTAFMPFVASFRTQGTQLLQNVAAQALSPMFKSLNSTLQGSIDLNSVDDGLSCILHGIDTLPDTGMVLSKVDGMNASIVAARPDLQTLLSSVNTISSATLNISADVGALGVVVSNLGMNFTSLVSSLHTVNNSLAPFSAAKTALIGSNAALIPSITAALTLLQPNVGLPNASFVAVTSGPADVTNVSVVGSLNRVIMGTMAGQSSEIDLLVSRLRDINATMAGHLTSTNFSIVADQLAQLASITSGIQAQTLPTVIQALNTARGLVDGLPKSSSIVPLVYSVQDATNALAFSPVIGALQHLNYVKSTIPNITDLIVLLDSVRSAADIVPCAVSIIKQVSRFNDTLITLPPAISDALGMLNDINSTVTEAMSQITEVQAQLADAQVQLNGVNLTSYIAQAQDAWASTNASVATFNISDVVARISQLDGAIAVNFSSITSSLLDLNATLASTTFDMSFKQQLRDFQDLKTAFLANISNTITDYAQMAGGYCSNAPAVTCSSSGLGCTSCDAPGSFRCHIAQGTTCSQDSDCPGGGDRCLADVSRAVGLKAGLDRSVTTAPNVAPSLAQLASAQTAASQLDVSGQQTLLQDAITSISNVDTSSMASDLNEISAAIATFDATTILDTLDSLNGVLDSVSISDFAPQIESLNSTISDIKGDKRDMIAGGQALLEAMMVILDVKLKGYLNTMSLYNLELAETVNGTGGVITTLLDVVQDAYDTIQSADQTLVSIPARDIAGIVPMDDVNKFTASGTEYADRMQFGLIYYVAANTLDNVLSATDPRAYGIFEDAQQTKYAGDEICLTETCISNSIDSYTSKTIKELSQDDVPLDITPLAFINLIWLFPGMVTVLALIALVGRYTCKNPRWQKCSYGWMTCCIMIQMPCCFLLAAFLFPLVIFMGDACASGKNVGYAMLLSTGDGLCDVLGGSGTLSACTLTEHMSLPYGGTFSVDASIDIPEYYASLMTGTGTCVGSNSPWSPVTASVISQLRTLPYKELQGFLQDSENPLTAAGLEIKVNMSDFLYSNANNTAGVLADWVDNLLDTTLSCSNIHGMMDGAFGVVCCTMYAPIYWIGSVFFLIAWFYCCCGLPVSILARKRLVSEPWGSVVEDYYGCCCCSCRTQPQTVRQNPRSKSPSPAASPRTGTSPRGSDANVTVRPKAAATNPSADDAGFYYNNILDAPGASAPSQDLRKASPSPRRQSPSPSANMANGHIRAPSMAVPAYAQPGGQMGAPPPYGYPPHAAAASFGHQYAVPMPGPELEMRAMPRVQYQPIFRTNSGRVIGQAVTPPSSYHSTYNPLRAPGAPV